VDRAVGVQDEVEQNRPDRLSRADTDQPRPADRPTGLLDTRPAASRWSTSCLTEFL
jgi:hypothetical protein